jgi:UDP-N-acetylglucosamine transferase subunit ALG13
LRLLVTVGNALQPFDRMLRTVDAALLRRPGAFDGVCQVGTSEVRPGGLRSVPVLSRPEFEEEMGRADIVISHAGVGSIHTALRYGHSPLVFARQARLGEHVNDHQIELVEAFADRARVLPADDEATLLRHLDAFLEGGLCRRTALETPSETGLRMIGQALQFKPPHAPPIGRFIARLLAAFGPPIERLQQPAHRTTVAR